MIIENRRKLMHCQEEKEQLELYQKQEVSQIKELVRILFQLECSKSVVMKYSSLSYMVLVAR